MEWLFWIAAALLVWLIAGYIRAEVGYRRMVSEWREAEPALDDHRLTVWERLPLYDWAERGDFERNHLKVSAVLPLTESLISDGTWPVIRVEPKP